MKAFFDPRQPIIQIGMNSDLSGLFADVCHLTRQEGFGFRQIIASGSRFAHYA